MNRRVAVLAQEALKSRTATGPHGCRGPCPPVADTWQLQDNASAQIFGNDCPNVAVKRLVALIIGP